jgi:hypothetical protein
MGTHKITGQFYIGYRCANKVPSHLDLGSQYFTSSKRVKELGFENFIWVIIVEFFSGKDAYDFEQDLIEKHWKNLLKLNMFHDKNKKWSTVDNPVNLGKKHSESSRQNMSQAAKGRIFSETHLKNLSIAGKNKSPVSEETKQKQSLKRKGKSHSHGEKISKAHREKPKIACPYCEFIGRGSNMKRWHFDNCKFRIVPIKDVI